MVANCEIPSVDWYYGVPPDWRSTCTAILRDELLDYPFVSRGEPCYYSKGKSSVIAVFDPVWSLHVQCLLGGSQQERERYDLRPGLALVSLDLGEGAVGRSRCCAEISRTATSARNAVYDAVRPLISRMRTGAQPWLCSPTIGRPDEHLAWQVARLQPGIVATERRVAHLMATFVRLLMPAGCLALYRWGRQNHVRIDGMG